LLNDLSAGQHFTCKLQDISIGGAQLEFPVNPELFVGQKTELEVFYPLKLESTPMEVQVVSIQSTSSNTIVRVRFTPITSEHIDALANHLIRFQFEVPPSKLGLDLSNTLLPKARIDVSTKGANNKYRIRGAIRNEEIFAAKVEIDESEKTVVLSELEGTEKWHIDEYLELLILYITEEWALTQENERLIVREDFKYSWFIGMRRNQNSRWEIPIAGKDMSIIQRYQKFAFTFAQTAYRTPNTLMESALVLYDNVRPKSKKTAVSWDEYGLVYDIMCEANSSYQLLLKGYRNWLTTNQNEIRTALDIGAGTGNFVTEAARALPHAKIDHIDRDHIMNFFAQEKYTKAGIDNVRLSTDSVDELTIEHGSYDLVTAIHSIYTLSDPHKTLSDVYNWLRPGGIFYVVDVGRTIDTNEWSKLIFMDCLRTKGLVKTIQTFWKGRKAVTQNKRIQATQDSGAYWNRSHSEFIATLLETGFEVLDSEITYRGNSDLAICIKPETSERSSRESKREQN